MRTLAAVHNIALALLTGGIAGVGMAVTVVFQKAATREAAGQIGNAIFGRLAWAVLVLAAVILATAFPVYRNTGPAWIRTAATVTGIAILLLALIVAFWLTPRMGAIWTGSEHAADGSGLAGDARKQFLMLHGISNLAYIGILLAGLVMTALSSFAARE